MPTIVTKN